MMLKEYMVDRAGLAQCLPKTSVFLGFILSGICQYMTVIDAICNPWF